jgi:hypothetical protein
MGIYNITWCIVHTSSSLSFNHYIFTLNSSINLLLFHIILPYVNKPSQTTNAFIQSYNHLTSCSCLYHCCINLCFICFANWSRFLSLFVASLFHASLLPPSIHSFSSFILVTYNSFRVVVRQSFCKSVSINPTPRSLRYTLSPHPYIPYMIIIIDFRTKPKYSVIIIQFNSYYKFSTSSSSITLSITSAQSIISSHYMTHHINNQSITHFVWFSFIFIRCSSVYPSFPLFTKPYYYRLLKYLSIIQLMYSFIIHYSYASIIIPSIHPLTSIVIISLRSIHEQRLLPISHDFLFGNLSSFQCLTLLRL